MQIGEIPSLLPGATPAPAAAAPTAPQTASDFQAVAMQQLGLAPAAGGSASTIASSLISLLSDDDSSADSSSSSSLSSLLGADDASTSTSSTDQLQEPPDSANALLLQAQLGL